MVSTPKFEEVKDIFVVEPKVVETQKQATFSFDLPLFNTPEPVAKVEENKVLFELTNETREIKVNEPVQFVPVTELTDKGIIRYSLEEFTEVENTFLEAKPTVTAVEEVIPEEMNITMKKVDFVSNTNTTLENISPMEMTIDETLKFRADERRKKLKEFNYKFHNNVSRIDELEKEPAYKRLGIDLSNQQTNSSNSRISLGTDSNDDLQLRSNNSYLHDNVD
jgi:cell division protein FtsZ